MTSKQKISDHARGLLLFGQGALKNATVLARAHALAVGEIGLPAAA
jgi:hypothetical protein